MAISTSTRNRINNVLNSNGATSGTAAGSGKIAIPKKQQQPRTSIAFRIGNRISRMVGFCLDRKICGTPVFVLLNKLLDWCHTGFEHFVYFLGPVLIVLATGIILLLMYTYYTILVPMHKDYYNNTTFSWMIVYVHMAIATFFFSNVIYNYFLCVTTKNSSGASYDLVVRQMASVTGFTYPETKEQLKHYEYEFDSKMRIRMKCRQDRRRVRTRQAVAIQQKKTGAAKQEIGYGTDDDDEDTLNNSSISHSAHSINNSSATINAKPTTTALLAAKKGKKSARRRRRSIDKDGASSCYSSTDEDTDQIVAHKIAIQKNKKPASSPHQNGGGGSSGQQPTTTVQQQQQQHQQPLQPTTTSPSPADNGEPAGGGTIRQWMLLGPYEWGYCLRTNQPKPPRSHYDHVTKGLVLCLDHYCPWMFNSVGYFNYRYFVNFLIYVTTGMMYGACLFFAPFQELSTNAYRNQIRYNKHQRQEYLNGKRGGEGEDAGGSIIDDYQLKRIEYMVPHPDERMPITLSFMMCAAVGVAVLILCVFHIYLTLTAQTTIEFHGNYSNRRKAKKVGKVWKNPYDFGWKRNWQQIYGTQPFYLALLPSNREPEFLPIPLLGDRGKRVTSTHLLQSKDYIKNSSVLKPDDVPSDVVVMDDNNNNKPNHNSTTTTTSNANQHHHHQDRITVGVGAESITTTSTPQGKLDPNLV